MLALAKEGAKGRDMNEVTIAAMLCTLLNGGETEVRHHFPNLASDREPYVRIDCETPTHVIEIGLDNKPGVRDSVHQAVFGAFLTNRAPDGMAKTPMVIVIDRDGVEDRYQYEARIVAQQLGIAYVSCSESFVQAWLARTAMSGDYSLKTLNNLPDNPVARQHCDLGPAFHDAPGAGTAALPLDKDGLFDDVPLDAALDVGGAE